MTTHPVATNPYRPQSTDIVLGEISIHITGMQYYDNETEFGQIAHLVREPQNQHDRQSIRVDNRRGEPLGHLPRRLVAWLAPPLDAGKLRVAAYVPKNATCHDNKCPINLSISLRPPGRYLLEKTTVTGKLDALHEVVRQAYQDAQRYQDASLIRDLAKGLRPLHRQELLPETRLLLELLPTVTCEVQSSQMIQAVATFCRALARLIIGKPLHHNNLTLFPLAWPEPAEAPYELLDTAVERGQAVVTEVDEHGEVPNLCVANKIDQPLLIPEGEILVGAKQNRVVNVTVLVAAMSSFTLPVSCVEQGRWQYRQRHFQPAFFAPPSLRRKSTQAVQETRAARGTADGDQRGVWAEVDACLESVGVHSSTASLTDGIESLEDDLQDYRENLTLPKGTAGILLARGNRIIGLDLFDCPATFEAIWPRLASAYFFDAVRGPDCDQQASSDQAEHFLRQVRAQVRPSRQLLGLGCQFEIAGGNVVGSALCYAGNVCHLAAFIAS